MPQTPTKMGWHAAAADYKTSKRRHRLFKPSVGTNLIHDFMAMTFSVKLAFYREKRPIPSFCEIHDFS